MVLGVNIIPTLQHLGDPSHLSHTPSTPMVAKDASIPSASIVGPERTLCLCFQKKNSAEISGKLNHAYNILKLKYLVISISN